MDTGLFACKCDGVFTGDFCEACSRGFRPDGHGGCAAEICFAAGSMLVCSGNGYCQVDDDGVYSCACASAVGAFCETCADDYKLLDGVCIS